MKVAYFSMEYTLLAFIAARIPRYIEFITYNIIISPYKYCTEIHLQPNYILK